MKIFPWKKSSETPLIVPSTETDFARLILENLPFIEKQCHRAVARYPAVFTELSKHGWWSEGSSCIDNDGDELINEVLDRLKADDYRVLREFRGKAKLTTFLTTIIANTVVDLLRMKKGRSRAKDRAKKIGDVAERLYDCVFCRGYSLVEAHGYLQTTCGIAASYNELSVMLERIRGHEFSGKLSAGEESWPYVGKEIQTDDGLELVVRDPAQTADELLVHRERKDLSRQVLDQVLEELSGEERLILSLRFPMCDDKKPMGNREIAEMLGLTAKAVDNRVRRILVRCREMVLKQGLSLEDMIDVGK